MARHQSHRADRAGGQPAAGLDQARAQAILMADSNLQVAAAGQADDVGGLLHVRRERFLDEHVASRLERIHGQSIVRQMGAENRQRVGGNAGAAAHDGR